MTASSRPFPERERGELADLLERLGPDAPTCCEGWDTAHLAAHLVNREARPDALPGLVAAVLATGRAAAEHHRVRDPPRGRAPGAAGLGTAAAPPCGAGLAVDRGRRVRPPRRRPPRAGAAPHGR